MRKGRLEKTRNFPKNSIDWERHSFGNGIVLRASAYLDARDMKTYAGLAEDNNYHSSIRRGFATIEEAFAWAESRVDYKLNKIKVCR